MHYTTEQGHDPLPFDPFKAIIAPLSPGFYMMPQTLDDVIEYLRGIGTILMEIDAKLGRLVREDGDDDDEAEARS